MKKNILIVVLLLLVAFFYTYSRIKANEAILNLEKALAQQERAEQQVRLAEAKAEEAVMAQASAEAAKEALRLCQSGE